MLSNPLLVSILVAASVMSFVITWFRTREPAAVEERIEQYLDQSIPLHQIELEESFVDRLLKPIAQSVLRIFGRLTPVGNGDRLRHDMVLAGNPGNLAMIDFLGLKLLSALVTGATVTAMLSIRVQTGAAILFGITGALVGLYLPNFWLKRRIKSRKTELMRALPDALDMLTISVNAGLGFDAALVKVAEKWDDALATEFERVIGEIRMGVRRLEALRHLSDRTDVPEISSFVAVLVQADRLGIGINDVLNAQSDQMRIRRRQWAEEQARKAPIKMLIPLVIFIFPALFVVILGPAMLRILAAFGGI